MLCNTGSGGVTYVTSIDLVFTCKTSPRDICVGCYSWSLIRPSGTVLLKILGIFSSTPYNNLPRNSSRAYFSSLVNFSDSTVIFTPICSERDVCIIRILAKVQVHFCRLKARVITDGQTGGGRRLTCRTCVLCFFTIPFLAEIYPVSS